MSLYAAIDAVTPYNPLYYLNRDRVGWWLCPPGMGGGGRFPNLMRYGQYDGDHGTLSMAIPATATSGWCAGRGSFAALNYDGTDDYVTLGTNARLAPLAALTVGCWIRTNSALSQYVIIKGSAATFSYYLRLQSGVNVRFGVTTGGGATTTTTAGNQIVSGQWHHAVGVWDGATMSVYVDGKLAAGPTAKTGTLANTTVEARLGADTGGVLPFSGVIGETWVVGRAMTGGEILDDYDLSSCGYRARDSALSWVIRRSVYGVVATTGIAFDAASNSGYQAAASTYNWSHTCTGSDRFLSVDVSLLSAGSTVTSITYNGVAMSLIRAQTTVTSFGRVESWGLAAPASGANSIIVTLSGSIASAGCAVSYTGVNQYTPTEAANSAQATNVGAADATVTVTPVADNCWIHGAVASDDASVTANQTTRNNVTGVGGSGADEDTGPITPAAATAVSYTGVGALATWAIAGYAIRPVASAVVTDGFRTTYPALNFSRPEPIAF